MNYLNNEDRAAQAFSEFEATGAEGAMIRANVTDEADVNRLVAEAGEKLGPVDIVVLNATPDQPQKSIEEYDWDFYQSMLDFFIKSPYLVTRAVLPHMKKTTVGPHHQHRLGGLSFGHHAVHGIRLGQGRTERIQP